MSDLNQSSYYDFVEYVPPSPGEWAKVQKMAGLSNSTCADRLGINISTVKRYRNGELAASKSAFFMLCILADYGVKIDDSPDSENPENQ